jgi:hypothetical protein
MNESDCFHESSKLELQNRKCGGKKDNSIGIEKRAMRSM